MQVALGLPAALSTEPGSQLPPDACEPQRCNLPTQVEKFDFERSKISVFAIRLIGCLTARSGILHTGFISRIENFIGKLIELGVGVASSILD